LFIAGVYRTTEQHLKTKSGKTYLLPVSLPLVSNLYPTFEYIQEFSPQIQNGSIRVYGTVQAYRATGK
jgi:hypothetical protein